MADPEQEPPKRKQAKSRIPTFRAVEEEAAFWDSHDLTEFADELEVVPDVRFVKARPKKSVTVRLEADTLAALAEQAREQGVAPATLARAWILERLHSSQSA